MDDASGTPGRRPPTTTERALRRRRPTRCTRQYARRIITKSVNSSPKRRFGERLRSRGLWNQRREFTLRVLAYNRAMLDRPSVHIAIRRGDL